MSCKGNAIFLVAYEETQEFECHVSYFQKKNMLLEECIVYEILSFARDGGSDLF